MVCTKYASVCERSLMCVCVNHCKILDVFAARNSDNVVQVVSALRQLRLLRPPTATATASATAAAAATATATASATVAAAATTTTTTPTTTSTTTPTPPPHPSHAYPHVTLTLPQPRHYIPSHHPSLNC